jgi:hypothetical protein
LVVHGRTGLIGETDAELADLCREAGRIDRAECRAEAKRRFSAVTMADAYESVYRRILSTADAPADSPLLLHGRR